MQHENQVETSKVRRTRRHTLIKLIVINFNFCQISAITKQIKLNKKINTKSNLETENKQEKKKRRKKKIANLINTIGINPDK